MGYFYTGHNYTNRKHGKFKLGETGKNNLNVRLSNIRHAEGHFQCLGYLILKHETRTERLFIESYARMMMEREPALTHVQNDHFVYDIEQGHKYEQAYTIAGKALDYAVKACKMIGVEYEYGTQIFPKKNIH